MAGCVSYSVKIDFRYNHATKAKENEMSKRTNLLIGLLTVAFLIAAVLPVVADEATDKAFEALKTYDWGQDRALLKPIDDAITAAHGDADARKGLETRLVAVLGTDVSRASKDFICRKISLIGSDASVPAAAALLTDEKLSHMGRYVLERIKNDAAIKALRDALPKVKGRQKIGVINSLGVCRDAESLSALVALLKDSDRGVASSAAAALGAIGNADAAKALAAFQGAAPKELKLPAADAYLACAEQLLADGKKLDAMMIYKALSKPEQPKHVRVAAMRGLLAATSK